MALPFHFLFGHFVMSRASRLLELLLLLRAHRAPVSAASLAQATEVSLRTIYRDIETLRGQGAAIDGEAGVGYVLRPGFLLPPLMFDHDEIESLVLGARWVATHADGPLRGAAHNAVAKIAAVLPLTLRAEIDAVHLLLGPGDVPEPGPFMAAIREAIRTEHKLAMSYVDAYGSETSRIVWPVALIFFQRALILLAWCEMRKAFRHFRLDRIQQFELLDVRMPRRRATLLAEWRASEAACENTADGI
jgi:predicted DNA-binding transcriptional regulator YafY